MSIPIAIGLSALAVVSAVGAASCILCPAMQKQPPHTSYQYEPDDSSRPRNRSSQLIKRPSTLSQTHVDPTPPPTPAPAIQIVITPAAPIIVSSSSSGDIPLTPLSLHAYQGHQPSSPSSSRFSEILPMKPCRAASAPLPKITKPSN
jgi:hypothetical protein